MGWLSRGGEVEGSGPALRLCGRFFSGFLFRGRGKMFREGLDRSGLRWVREVMCLRAWVFVVVTFCFVLFFFLYIYLGDLWLFLAWLVLCCVGVVAGGWIQGCSSIEAFFPCCLIESLALVVYLLFVRRQFLKAVTFFFFLRTRLISYMHSFITVGNCCL